MDILKPAKLQSGDTIGLVAPAYPFPSDKTSAYYKQYELGKQELEAMGFHVKEGRNLRQVQWWRAGTPQERAADINEMFADTDVEAIIAHDGGNDCISVLEYIDYELVRNNPKPFMGFSNITNIHSALFAKTGLIGFHMGMLTYELGGTWQTSPIQQKQIAKNYFQRILTNNQAMGVIEPLTTWEPWRPGQAEGILFGGNLSMLDSIIGTPYFPKVDDLRGSIFFWELDSSPTYRIERVLTHLKYVGLLDLISGMVVGKLADMKNSATGDLVEPSARELVLTVLQDYNFPILAEVDFGHKIAQLPMPIGIKSRIDAEKLTLEFLESAVV